MKQFKSIAYLLITLLALASCKSKTKQQTDELYSRHLQQHVKLTIITTPLPDNKEEMNLLFFIPSETLDATRLKTITDSLYKKKQLQPLTIVAFDGKAENYGVTSNGKDADKKIAQLNDFVINELYPFCKKKVTVRKFNSVAICGLGNAAGNAFTIAWNHDEKIGKAGLFYPQLSTEDISTISASRMRPKLDVWMNTIASDSNAIALKKELDSRSSVHAGDILFSDPVLRSNKKVPGTEAVAGFLLWAFGK